MTVKKRPGDLSPFLVPPPDDPYEFLQGVLTAIDPEAGTNTVELAGELIQTNLIVVGDPSELTAGDAVLVLRLRTRYFILGPLMADGNLSPEPRGIVAYSQRASTRATADNTTEVGVIRLDATLHAGRAYEVRVSGIRITGGTTPHYKTTIRYNAAGAAVVGSTEVARSEGSTSTDNLPDMVALIQPGASTVTGSFWFGLQRTSAGAGAITLQNDDANSNLITIRDLGLELTDTGTDL